jgi:NADH-quinone oxidoreductase subunit C
MIPTLDTLAREFGARFGSAVSAGNTEPAPPEAAPVRQVPFAARGWHLDAAVPAGGVAAAAEILDRNGFAIDAITGVDWMAQQQMEVVYDFFHPLCGLRVVVRARVPRDTPLLPTISGVFPGADWHERETHDFFGIRFEGHPNLAPFLLPEDADYHPLRKDFTGETAR